MLFHFFILLRSLEDALKQVLGVGDLQAELVLEALDQGTKQLCVGLL